MPALYTKDGSGVRIVPPGDTAEEFCLCSFVRASASGYAAATGLLALPGHDRGVLPLLCADGSVYLPSCPVIDSGGNWSAGGYLGVVACDVAVTYPAFVPFDPPSDYPLGQTETIRVEALGVIPGAFSSGLRLDGISVPPQAQSRFAGGTVSLDAADPQPFLVGVSLQGGVARSRVGVLNRIVTDAADYSGNVTFSATVSGLVGVRLRVESVWPTPPFDPADKFTDSTTPWNQQTP